MCEVIYQDNGDVDHVVHCDDANCATSPNFSAAQASKRLEQGSQN